jgi:hypothetical protein
MSDDWLAWPDRTRFSRVVANRYHKIELYIRKLFPGFAACFAGIDVVIVS